MGLSEYALMRGKRTLRSLGPAGLSGPGHRRATFFCHLPGGFAEGLDQLLLHHIQVAPEAGLGLVAGDLHHLGTWHALANLEYNKGFEAHLARELEAGKASQMLDVGQVVVYFLAFGVPVLGVALFPAEPAQAQAVPAKGQLDRSKDFFG